MNIYAKSRLHTGHLLLVFVMVMAGLMNPAIAGSDLYPKVTIQESSGDKCVLPKDEIRKVHPDLLKHDRVKTMRQGIRNSNQGKHLDGSLKACINCHAIKDKQGEFVRVSDPQHFCTSCHIYAGVTFDCFQCHRDIPEK